MNSKFDPAKCVALVPADSSVRAWERCEKTALWGDRFCAAHRDALDGAVLGLLNVNVRERQPQKTKKKHIMRRRKLRSKSANKNSTACQKKS